MNEEHDKLAALLDAVRILDEIGLGYALIGGVAVGIHSGLPRATLDTDFAVLSTVDRPTLIRAMTEAGFRCTGDFEHRINFRHSNEEAIQLAFDAGFDPMIERAETITIRSVAVAIVGKDDLIAMKRRAAAVPLRRKSKALRDQADVELLLGDLPDPDEGW
jgi:predicted nucleotidyltransferase